MEQWAQSILLEAWDYDESTLNDKLGFGSLLLEPHRAALEAGDRVEVEVPLEYTKLLGGAEARGQVFIALAWEAKG